MEREAQKASSTTREQCQGRRGAAPRSAAQRRSRTSTECRAGRRRACAARYVAPLSHCSPWHVLSLPQAKQGLRSSSSPVSCCSSAHSRACRSCPSRWYTHLPAQAGVWCGVVCWGGGRRRGALEGGSRVALCVQQQHRGGSARPPGEVEASLETEPAACGPPRAALRCCPATRGGGAASGAHPAPSRSARVR